MKSILCTLGIFTATGFNCSLNGDPCNATCQRDIEPCVSVSCRGFTTAGRATGSSAAQGYNGSGTHCGTNQAGSPCGDIAIPCI